MEQNINRRKARNAAVQLVCAAGFHYGEGCDFDEIYINGLETLEINDDEYVRRLYYGVAEKYPELDAMIESCLKGWKVSRLSKVTLAILRTAAYEIMYVDGLAFQIAINEAVNIAKTFDDDKAPRFINGVLNSIAVKTGAKSVAAPDKESGSGSDEHDGKKGE